MAQYYYYIWQQQSRVPELTAHAAETQRVMRGFGKATSREAFDALAAAGFTRHLKPYGYGGFSRYARPEQLHTTEKGKPWERYEPRQP